MTQVWSLPTQSRGSRDTQLQRTSHLGAEGTESEQQATGHPRWSRGTRWERPEARSGPLALRKASLSRLDPGGGTSVPLSIVLHLPRQAQEWGGRWETEASFHESRLRRRGVWNLPHQRGGRLDGEVGRSWVCPSGFHSGGNRALRYLGLGARPPSALGEQLQCSLVLSPRKGLSCQGAGGGVPKTLQCPQPLH